jgi:hypothetical protein
VSTTSDREMQISERELLSMTSDLQDLHSDTLPQMLEATEGWAEVNHQLRGGVDRIGRTAASRRTFLVGLGAAAGVAALAACGKSSSTTTVGPTPTSTTPTTTAALGAELAIVSLAASLENLAVQTYQAGLDAAKANKLGTVPPAVATFAMTAQAQHKDHAGAWNALLAKLGQPTVTGVDTTVNDAVVKPGLAQVTDVTGLAKLALQLEMGASATYLSGIGAFHSPDKIQIAASIQPVEMQHVAILNFVLGTYPVPDSFGKTDGARTPDDKIG